MLKKNILQTGFCDWILILYSFLIPLGHALQNLGIILLAIMWLITIKNFKQINKQNLIIIVLFCSYYLIEFISLIYSSNISNGKNILLRQLPLVLIPIFLLSHKFTVKRNIFFYCVLSFSLSLALVVVINFLFIFQNNNFNIWIIKELHGKDFATGIVNYHYLYLAYYISVSISLLLFFILHDNSFLKNKKQKGCLLILIIFFTAYLLLLGSRMSLLTTFFINIIIFYFYYKKINSRIYNLGFILLISVIFLTVYKLDLPIVEKMKEMVNYNGEYSDMKKTWGGRSMREEIWFCAGSLILDKPILGYGIGSVQAVLDDCLNKTSDYPILYNGKFRFNAHNQFFQFWLSCGVLGITAFLLFVLLTIKQAYKNRNFLYIIFLLVSVFSFTTESMLERNHGIILFAFLSALLYKIDNKELFKISSIKS